MNLYKFATATLFSLGLSSAAFAATFQGEFWDAATPVGKLEDADAIIAGGDPNGIFDSTGIDYPQLGDVVSDDATSLADFLGSDADSLAGDVGIEDATLTDSVFRFTGFLDLLAGEQLFSVGSDDGFRLTIGGVVISSAEARSFSTTDVVVDAGVGITAFELIYFERTVVTGVNFSIDGVLAAPADPVAAVPLPAGLPLILAALGTLGLAARRSNRAA